MNLLYQAAKYLTHSSLPHCTKHTFVLLAANGNTDKPKNVGAFDTAAVEYSSLLAGSCCCVVLFVGEKKDRLKSS